MPTLSVENAAGNDQTLFVLEDGSGNKYVAHAMYGSDDGSTPQLIKTDGSGHPEMKLIGTITVDATDLDIRALSESQDSVLIFGEDSGGTPRKLLVDGNGKLDVVGTVSVDSLPNVTVSSLPDVTQTTHDNLNANANVQQGDADVGAGNPLHTQTGDGNNATLGAQADAAETSHTATASQIAFIKGLVQIIGDTWDDTNNALRMSDINEIITFPHEVATGQDLSASAYTTSVLDVSEAQAILIRAHETTGGTLDVSIEWFTDSGGTNSLGTESAADLALDNITTDWARVVRKGLYCQVTFTNNSGATSTNVMVDTHV